MALVLTDEQKVALTVAFTTAAGNPAKIDGIPKWQTSDETILTITPDADGQTATATTVGPIGTAQVSVTADADLGEGTREITGTLDVEVHAAEAVTVGINAGTPEPK